MINKADSKAMVGSVAWMENRLRAAGICIEIMGVHNTDLRKRIEKLKSEVTE